LRRFQHPQQGLLAFHQVTCTGAAARAETGDAAARIVAFENVKRRRLL
jgi:hypothetical protein